NWCQLSSATSTSKCRAAFLMLANAWSRSSSVTPLTWSNRASAFCTCEASVSGSLRLPGNAYALSGSSFRSLADNSPCSSWGLQVVFIPTKLPTGLRFTREVVMSQVRGALFGGAFGDALGAPTEFLPYDEVIRKYGPRGPRELPTPALVTDDTQMSLAVADALLSAMEVPPLTPERLEPRIRGRFLHWWDSPDNDRAPGHTCMDACAAMAAGLPWRQATVEHSKGCGANMRVAPVGLVPGVSEDQRAGAAQLQAAMTHGHPTGLAASELTAFTVYWLSKGLPITDLPEALRDRCASQRTVYREDWLGD